MTESIRSLLHSLSVQWRVIKALFLRETLTRYGRNNIGFLWLFVEPIIFIIVVGGARGIRGNIFNFPLPYIAFAVTGYCSMLLWRGIISRSSGAISSNQGLLYHRNVKVLDFFASRILMEFAGTTGAFLTLWAAAFFFGEMTAPHDVMKMILGWALLTWVGISFALVIGSLSDRYELIDKILNPVLFILMPLSGVFFMVDWLPPEYQKIILALPMVHGLELLREGYFGYAVRAHYDLGYVSVFCLITTLIGLLLVKGTSSQVSPS